MKLAISNPAADYFDCPHGSHDTGTCWGDSIYQDFTYPVEIDGFYIGDRQSAYDYVQEAEGGAKQRKRYQAIIDQTDSYFDGYASVSDSSEVDSEIGSSNQNSIAKEILEELLSLPGFTGFGSNVSVTNNTTNVTNNTNIINNTNNYTTTNISNSGSGDVTVGDIGTVNNTTNVDNSFTIQTISVNLAFAITGDSKKSDKVEGTDGDDLIADGFGKDKLIGGDGADQFYFSGEEPFKKKTVDKVIDFDASEGDAILIDEDVIFNPAVNDQIIERLADTSADEIPVAENNSQLKQLSDDGHQFIYNEPKGELLIDSNGEENGFAGKDADPLLAKLGKNTELTDALIDDVLDELEADPSLAIAESKKELKSLAKEDYDLIYFEPKGDLYVDGNGDSKGFGKKLEGGMIADLPNYTILTESDVLIGV